MFDRSRLLRAALLITMSCMAGCGEDKSADPDDSAPVADATAADGGDAAAEAESNAEDAPAQPAPKPKIAAASDVPMPPDYKPEPGAPFDWIHYNSTQKPAELAAFYQKAFPAKGWTLGRNDIGPLAAMKTLTGAIQEYRKGPAVHTVVLTEQLGADGNFTMVMVLDIPLSPTTTQAVAFGQQAVTETSDAPAAAIDWYTKNLAPLGWAPAGPPKDLGGATQVQFKKGNRTIDINFRLNATTKGSAVNLNHTPGFAE